MISCAGGTPTARLAADVTSALEDLGVAEAVQDLDVALAASRSGRPLIVLDGCPSGCRSRLLEVKGALPESLVNLADLGVTAEGADAADAARLAGEIAARLRSRRQPRRPLRSQRPAPPTPASRTKPANSVDDYLLAIDSLASTTVDCGALTADAPTLAAHVSRLLGVSRASAGEMLARIEASGLVERGSRKELLLTTAGRSAADRAVRRHRVLECLAHDFLGYPPAECYERARLLDGAFDDEAVERASAALGSPERCPHGWPVDPERAREESRELTTLAALAEGLEPTVVRVAEHDGALLSRIYELGMAPGARVSAGSRRALDPAAAAEVFVRAS